MGTDIFGAGILCRHSRTRNRKAIEQYIRRQLQKNIASDQISLNEYIDPFTGERVNKSKK